MATDGQKEAIKTYLEQTKLLVTLSSAFLFAPAGLVGILKDKVSVGLNDNQICWFIVTEVLFIISVLAGYVVVATIAGSQAEDKFDIYRCATRISSLVQFFCYLLGLFVFMVLAVKITS